MSEFSHPGGPVALSLAFNRDATALFEAHHMLTSRQKLRAILKKYEVPPDSKRAKALEAGKVDEGAASPYLWPRADVTGRSDPGEPDRFEEELKEMAQAHFSAEAKRRGVDLTLVETAMLRLYTWECAAPALLIQSLAPGSNATN